MKNYEIGRLAEGVLRGAKMIVVFERERSVLKTVVVFEREQLYRPSGDPIWPFWQKGSSGGRKGCLSSNDSAGVWKSHSSSSERGSAAPLRTHSAKLGKMVKIKRAKLLPPAPQHQKRKTVLWCRREQLFCPSEDAFCQTRQNGENQARKGAPARTTAPKTENSAVV